MNETKDIGEKVKKLREAKKWSLERLSAISGVSESFLSRVENGKSTLSISNLTKISEALGVSPVEFFTTGIKKDKDFEIKKTITWEAGAGYKYSLLTQHPSDIPLPYMFYQIIFLPHKELSPFRSHQGYETLFLMSGQVEVLFRDIVTNNTKCLKLNEGETISFASRFPHTYRNSGLEQASGFTVVSDTEIDLSVLKDILGMRER